ncbi:MAG: formylglycine-generating enzyme family protein, partial [Chloroflexaceae bacterium]|nr:formylglycine-generating enzyme family protein [Chloroflexaceae bacterium]
MGGWGEDVKNQPDRPAVPHALPQYWIARTPITNAQWQAWVDAGGEPSYAADESRSNTLNQPVVAVTWFMCRDFCAWLTQQLAGALPEGYEIRLPTEAEWEVAAAYDGRGNRRMYPWGDTPEPNADHAIFADAQGNNLGAAAPVGVCVAGAAACGAADMAGNVFE